MEPEPRPPEGPDSWPRAPTQVPPGSSFSAGHALASSFRIFGRHLPVLLLLAAAFHAIPAWLELLRQAAVAKSERAAADGVEGVDLFDALGGGIGLLTLLADSVFPLAFQALVTFAVFRTLRGGPAHYGESIAIGVRRLPQALGTSFTIGLMLGLPFFGLTLLGQDAPGVLATLALLWAIFALFLMCTLFVAVQTAVVEGANPLRAMLRSAFLTRGARGRIFGIVLVTYALPALLAGMVEAVAFPEEDLLIVDTPRVLLVAGFDVFFAGLQAVTCVVVYHALRSAREGVGLDELLAVFD